LWWIIFSQSDNLDINSVAKLHMLANCLAHPQREIRNERNELFLIKIKEYFQQKEIESIEQLKEIIKIVENEPEKKRLQEAILLSWADENVSKSPTEVKQLLESFLQDENLSQSDFIHLLNHYTVLFPYTDFSIKQLQNAQKRKDLNIDQQFYVETRLAVFTVCKNGLQSLEKLIKKYPERRQCVALCGEQIALEYVGNLCNDADSAYQCYQRVFEFCPELKNEPSSLLSFTVICQQLEKFQEVVPLLKNFSDMNPLNLRTLDVLTILATICMNDTKDYTMAYECYKKIVNYEGLLTPEMKIKKELAKKNMQTALALSKLGHNGLLETVPIRVAYWSIGRIILMSSGVFMMLLAILFTLINRRKKL
jgi:tetratricopeptide (TPR) repeat protein